MCVIAQSSLQNFGYSESELKRDRPFEFKNNFMSNSSKETVEEFSESEIFSFERRFS